MMLMGKKNLSLVQMRCKLRPVSNEYVPIQIRFYTKIVFETVELSVYMPCARHRTKHVSCLPIHARA